MGIFIACMVSIAKHFLYNRTIASGIALSGGSLGTIVLPFLSQACLEAFTLRGIFLIYAGLMLNFVVAGVLVKSMEHQPIILNSSNKNVKSEKRKNDNKSLEEGQIPKTNKNEQKVSINSSHHDIRTKTDKQVEQLSTNAGEETLTKFETFKKFLRPFLFIKFISISLFYFCKIYGVYGFLFYIPPYLVELGLSKSQVTLLCL